MMTSMIGLQLLSSPSRIFSMRSSSSIGFPNITSSLARVLMNCMYLEMFRDPLMTCLICSLICLMQLRLVLHMRWQEWSMLVEMF